MILVTGGSGLLGAHLLETGLSRGRSIRVVSRSISGRTFLARVRDRVDVVSWDLASDDAPPDGLLRGVDAVIHAAALASPFVEDEPRMRALNVEGTLRLHRRAREAGVMTWVQVSSIAALSGGAPRVVTEEGGAPRDTPYARTKRDADDALAKEPGGDRILTVHPTFMLGPWDARPSSGAVFAALRMRRLRHFADVVKNVADASSVADGIWRALDRGATGHYVLGGIDVPLARLLGEAANRLCVPPPALLPELPEEPTPEIPARELAVLRELSSPSPSSSAKAIRDFDYRVEVDLDGLLDRTLRYLAEHRIAVPKPRRPV